MRKRLIDFSDPVAVAAWSSINDGVMGGLSASTLHYDPNGHAVFSGNVSFENNGGFASVRCEPADYAATGTVAYVLEIFGDGKRYKLNLRTDNAFDGVNYQCSFDAPAGIWSTCKLAIADFLPRYRGRAVPEALPLDPARVRQIGLMIADRQAGDFALSLRSISAEQCSP